MAEGFLHVKFLDSTSTIASALRHYDVVVLDLEGLGFISVVRWLTQAGSGYLNDNETVSPVMVAAGRSSELEAGQYQDLVNAGAVFYEKPTDENWKSTVETKLNETYRNTLHDDTQWGYIFESKRGRGLKDSAEGEDRPPGDEPTPDDLSIYVEPPFSVRTEDYERLLNRMQTADDDWKKDD